MNAVTSALSRGEITPGEAKTIAGVVDTFIGRSKHPRTKAFISICERF
jgi:hypothetical protein